VSFVGLISATHSVGLRMSSLRNRRDIRPAGRPSVPPSVTLVDCNHMIVQEKVEMGTRHAYVQAEAASEYIMIRNSTQEDE